jgi:hypothetical protein
VALVPHCFYCLLCLQLLIWSLRVLLVTPSLLPWRQGLGSRWYPLDALIDHLPLAPSRSLLFIILNQLLASQLCDARVDFAAGQLPSAVGPCKQAQDFLADVAIRVWPWFPLLTLGRRNSALLDTPVTVKVRWHLGQGCDRLMREKVWMMIGSLV